MMISKSMLPTNETVGFLTIFLTWGDVSYTFKPNEFFMISSCDLVRISIVKFETEIETIEGKTIFACRYVH